MAKLGRLIAKWKRLYLRHKPLELELEKARHAVRDGIIESGEKFIASKLGTIALQTKTVTDWEALARSALKPEFIAQMLPMFTRESAAFVAAPRDWGAEARS